MAAQVSGHDAEAFGRRQRYTMLHRVGLQVAVQQRSGAVFNKNTRSILRIERVSGTRIERYRMNLITTRRVAEFCLSMAAV